MENQIKYAIIEDNPFAMNHLRMMISKLRPQWENVFTGVSVSQAVDFLQSQSEIDLIFMDIELGDGKCFNIFERTGTIVPIIFTTAYNEYAIKAFKVNGVDYLLKPITEKDLSHAIDKYEHIVSRKETVALESDKNKSSECRILTVSGDKYSYIRFDDVSHFISEDHYVYAVLKENGKRMLNIDNLAEIESIMPPDRFFRVTRNIIVSIDSVVSAGKFFRGRLLLKISTSEGETEVVVPASRRDDFLRWLGR
ncbi:MAG: LytTR family DNA-binding domain-containing protein [Prevotella sp.]|nr:LytTR family DNA-binding domain-containing protein [Prevotella sp.]MCM1075463.1 LytTR family DNA-binding domain-containing protein [Ruminococcus sp.]